jgi:hypothetical protein
LFVEVASDMPDPLSRPATSRRAAWVIVIIMSTVFVLALLGVIWGFVRQARLFMVARHAPSVMAPAAADPATIILAPGARIVSATTDVGKLVLHVTTPAGAEVEIIDLSSGRLTGRIRTQH